MSTLTEFLKWAVSGDAYRFIGIVILMVIVGAVFADIVTSLAMMVAGRMRK